MNASRLTHPQALSQLLDNLKVVLPLLETANYTLIVDQLKEQIAAVEALAFPNPISVEAIQATAAELGEELSADQAQAALKVLSERLVTLKPSDSESALLLQAIQEATLDDRTYYKVNTSLKSSPAQQKTILIDKSIAAGFIQILRSEGLENGRVINDDEALLRAALFCAIDRRNQRFDSGSEVTFLSLEPGLFNGLGRQVSST